MSSINTESSQSKITVCGVILAGGRSRRMLGGADKFLLEYRGKSVLEHVIELAAPQVDALTITINGDPARLPSVQTPVILDQFGEHEGPLAGILTAMLHNQTEAEWLATFPADTTNFPSSWVTECIDHAITLGLPLAYATSNAGPHFTFAVWSVTSFKPLKAYFESGNRSIKGFVNQYPQAATHFDKPFININTAHDWRDLNNPPQ